MGTNYEKGRKKEQQIARECRNAGHIAVRSAASKSPIDIIDIDVNERVIRFIQSKPDSMSENARNKLLEENSKLNGSFFCRFEVV